MNDCTRSSQSFCFADIVKSMERSSPRPGPLEGLGSQCCPAALAPQDSLRGAITKSLTGPVCRGAECPRIDKTGSQTIVSYKCLKCNSLPDFRHSGATRQRRTRNLEVAARDFGFGLRPPRNDGEKIWRAI